jgi:hypothetical protein
MGKARRTSQNELRDPGKMFKLPENEGGGEWIKHEENKN